MSRFRKALAAAAMAVATAGGGLLATAAAAAPAHAATPAGGHTTTGFTAVPAAQAAGGIGPKFQCGDTCDPNGGGNPPPPPPPPTITCTISTVTPWQGLSGALIFHADTVCTGNVAQIAMSENVIHPRTSHGPTWISKLALRPTTTMLRRALRASGIPSRRRT